MLLFHFRGVEVDYCERCRGAWLDAGEVEALLGNRSDPLFQLFEEHGRAAVSTRALCPRCDARLEEFDQNGVLLDRCPRGHGIWFDAGELPRLAALCGASQTVGFLQELFGDRSATEKEDAGQ